MKTRLRPADAAPRLDADVIIIGAGFGGLGLAIRLKKARKASFIVLERAPGLGGTWRDNIYPGCACDIPAMLYSFSFAHEAAWTRIYPQQAEILAYLERTVKKTRIGEHVRYNSDVAEARFDEVTRTWAVTLTDGSVLRSRAIVSAMGPLNKPKFPEVPGRERFDGPAFHSSEWDYAVDLDGKNVIVIGTGASAIQFVPQIAPHAGRLTIFQRTAPWIRPRDDKPVGTAKRLARKLVPFYSRLVRQAVYWTNEVRALGFVYFPKLLERAEVDLQRYIHAMVKDPVLRVKVTPDYRAGCKRILVSDDYYPALARPNVELVTERIDEIREHSLVSAGREIPADVIIYGTGFRATEGIAPVRIFGTNGRELGEVWRDGIEAYLGTTIPGFPNAFLIIGPNTGLGHNSMVFMMEAQYQYILGALAHILRKKARALDVKPEIARNFNDDVQERMKGTVWATGCSSWYQDARGKNVSLWPGFTFAFRRRTARFDRKNYRTV